MLLLAQAGDARLCLVDKLKHVPHVIFKGVRYLLTGRQPEPAAILLVESGSRGIVERMLPPLRKSWGAGAPIHRVSCFATLPEGSSRSAWRVTGSSSTRSSASIAITHPFIDRA